MAEILRRRFLSSAALAFPAGMLVNTGQADGAENSAHQMKVTRIEALLLEKPLTDRFWMSITPDWRDETGRHAFDFEGLYGCRRGWFRRGHR